MKKSLILIVLLLLPYLNLEAGEQTLYKMPGTEVVPIKSSVNGGQYELYIKLPEKYSENPDKKYPVIYFTDAVWHIELLSATTAFMMEEVILVGVSWQKDMDKALMKERGAHVSRYRDYSAYPHKKPKIQAKYNFGQANHHLAFIREDVFKYVESRFRTQPDNRSYFGYSMGGEFGAYVLLAQANTFKNYILGSPSFGKDVPFYARLISKLSTQGKSLNANVFVAYGTQEKESGKYIDEFMTLLKNTKDESLSLKHELIEGDHGSAFPMTGVRSIAWLKSLQTGDKK
ncbi:alpha/beta hydrolase [Pleionea sp. CnH1-48]|uniref:alpha/beta hydrolase n=1 Tax=Pleionea sp. CnH1-48 TaxID=2954494 RepID=UPI00209851B3|nr:alpha/beta hydrolase-fold protein [Pleionea sp. CnH1-48]MCO7224385.1 alpha/beta hydrolase-fold protein [Pleionea sp. CnH1-48]